MMMKALQQPQHHGTRQAPQPTAAEKVLHRLGIESTVVNYCFSVRKSDLHLSPVTYVGNYGKNRTPFGSESTLGSNSRLTHVQGHHELFQFQELSSVRLVGAQLFDYALQVVRLFLPGALTTETEFGANEDRVRFQDLEGESHCVCTAEKLG